MQVVSEKLCFSTGFPSCAFCNHKQEPIAGQRGLKDNTENKENTENTCVLLLDYLSVPCDRKIDLIS